MATKNTITVYEFAIDYRGYTIAEDSGLFYVYKEGDFKLLWEAGSKMAAKLWIDRQIQTATKPDAGDLVYMERSDDCLIKPGSYGVIDGIAGRAADSDGEVLVTFNPTAGRAFFGPKDKYDEGPEFCSCSGGPGWYIPIDQLEATGRTRVQHFWKWKDYPRGNGGVEYKREVNVWRYDKPEREVSQ